ncbi:hypothetical protein KAJ27_06785, partial [bacterium]|nr:hypothetical protein [bacterium]
MAKKKNKALLKIYFLSAILFLILFLPSILLNIYFNTSTGRANLETALKKYGIAVDFKYCLTLFPVITKIENGIIKYKDSKIKFKSISVKLKLLSLLKGNIEITKLGLDNLAVHFMGKKISKINGMISLPFKRIPKFNLHGYIQNQTGKPGVSISASNQKKESIITLKMSNTAEEFDSIFATSIYQTIVKKYSIKLRKKMNIKATIDIDKLSQPEFKIFVPDLEFKENRFKNTSIYIVKKRNKYKFQISSAAINGNLIFDKHMKFEAGNFKLQMDTLYGKLNSDLTISNKKHGISFKAKNLQFRSPLGFTVLSRKISTLFTSDNHIKDLVIQKTALYIKGYKKPLIFKYNKFDINKKNLSGTGLLIFPEQQNKIIRKISIYSLFKRIIDLPFKYSVVYDGKIISVSSEDKNIELYFTPSSSSLTFRIRKQISSKGIVENLLDLSNQNQVKVTKFFEDGTLKFDITGLVSNWKLKNVTVNHILFTKKEKKISFELTDCNITELLKNDSKNHIQ